MKISPAAAAFLLMLPCTAGAICARSVDETREKAIRSASIVFVATITEARMKPEDKDRRRYISRARDIWWYTVQYRFDVAIPIKGDASAISFLETPGIWADPKAPKFASFAEQSKFVPGDSILVIARGPGEVPISWSFDCTDSAPWSKAALDALKAAGLWKRAQSVPTAASDQTP